MVKEHSPIPFDEFSHNLRSIFERVARGKETVVVEKEAGELVVLKPAPTRKVREAGKRKKTEADRKAFLSSAGGWTGLVDGDKLLENIYESRRISTKPPVKL